MASSIAYMNATGPRPPRRPTFAWQAALVVLPVVILAALGLVSLRQDRALAEQQAKESAQVLANQVALRAAQAVEQSCRAYDGILYERRVELESALGRGLTNVDAPAAIMENRQAFEKQHPDLVLASLPRVRCRLDAAGRPLEPRDYPASPSPPAWLTQLGADQLQLWQAAQARSTPATSGSAGRLEKCTARSRLRA